MLDFDLDDDYDTALFFALAHLTQQQTRRPKYPTERVNWEEHLQKELYQNSFHRTYRMSYPSFMKLKGLLGDKIVLNGARSTASSGTAPIIPQVVMACGIRWLAGGSPTDIKNAYGLTVSTVYRLRDLFLDAVCTTDELDIRLPDLSNPSEISKFRSDFEKLSSSGVCKGCVGVLDGMLQRIGNPSVACAEGQVRSYFSGHYNCPGLNVLAMCDAFLRFTFFGVLNPGSASDRMTYLKSRLPAFVDSLPFGTYVIGDAAFFLGDNLLIPFTGTYKLDPSNDVYNFHISQLRIRIEMAFGHLTNKWRVLRRPLGGKLARQSQVLEVCARLHNFGINERILGEHEQEESEETEMSANTCFDSMELSPAGLGYLPTLRPFEEIPGSSAMRNLLVDHIRAYGLTRSQQNVARKREHEKTFDYCEKNSLM